MTTQDLNALRQAVQAREADQSQFMLKRLFQELEFVRALGIAAEQVHQYLPTFERDHPDEVWPRRMLNQIVMTATAPDRVIIEQALQHFDTPGTANFIKALFDLFQATQKEHASEARLGFLVSATVNAMTAELVELYFGDKPTAWADYRSQSEGAQQIALDFWTNADVAARDRERWLQTVDAVEQQLKQQ